MSSSNYKNLDSIIMKNLILKFISPKTGHLPFTKTFT